MSWLSSLFGSSKPTSEVAQPADDQVIQQWAVELGELVQKTARAQAKLAVKLDDVAARVEGGFANLEAQRKTSEPVSAEEVDWEELLDALDLLEAALASAEVVASPALGDGLRGVLRRLERVLSSHSLTRLKPRGELPDGRLFRVVGTHPEPELPEGVVSRVVRAAVMRGEQLVREGEVLTNRRSA